MNKIFIFFFIISTQHLFSQTHAIEELIVNLSGNASVSDFSDNTYYHAYDSCDVSWTIIDDSIPNGWLFSICFPICYSPGITSASQVFPNNSENIESWKSHYYKKNRIYWVCNIICVITVILHLEYSMYIVHGTKYYMLYFFVFIPSIIMSSVGYLFQKSIYQWIVLILSLISIIFNCVTVFLGQQVEVPK